MLYGLILLSNAMTFIFQGRCLYPSGDIHACMVRSPTLSALSAASLAFFAASSAALTASVMFLYASIPERAVCTPERPLTFCTALSRTKTALICYTSTAYSLPSQRKNMLQRLYEEHMELAFL